MGTVLLTNAQLRKTLAAARSLGSKGVDVFTVEETHFSPAAFSKHCKGSVVCPSACKKPREFESWLLDTVKKLSCDVLFPMDDDTLEVVMKNRNELEKYCSLPLPPIESYVVASDKSRATVLARKAGVDCPETVIPDSLDNLLESTAHLRYPLVVKPRKSSGSRGIRVVKEEKDLIRVYKEVASVFPSPFIQEYIGTGEKIDICLLYNRDSQLRAHFVQKELRHFPEDIGPSTVQESILDSGLLNQALKLMKHLKWYGIVEIEFMVDRRDNKPKFMEINPRFWNSLEMAILAGVDFPWMLYRIALDGDVPEVFNYKTGLKCKWLLPGDFLYFLTSKNRFRMNPPLLAGKKHNTFDDILSIKDPFPTLGFILACLRYIFSFKKWEFVFRR